jgi:hypothetical protein
MVSEMADVRSWNMLPASIQVQRLALDPGSYYLQQPSQTRGLSVTDIAPVIPVLAASIDPALVNATASITDKASNSAAESDNGFSLPQSNTMLANDKGNLVSVDVPNSETVAMTNIRDVPVVVSAKPLLLKPGKTVLLFYSSAAKKAYYILSP